ncbi:MAG: tetratricopeptide repeat protein, partial [Candidatus Omnitrophica bacterium]|nr:tetratricopeptide repeat protein [Candidatus Omnitrophota bacterium]
LLLEISLRFGGFLFLSLENYKNTASLFKKNTYRIMCLGESTTVWGGKNNYPGQMERILNKNDLGIKFTVINKGVPGTNTEEIVNNLNDNLNKYKPDMVITVMGINDNIHTDFVNINAFEATDVDNKQVAVCECANDDKDCTCMNVLGSNDPSLRNRGIKTFSFLRSLRIYKLFNIIIPKKIVPDDSGENTLSFYNQAEIYRFQGDCDNAESLFQRSVEEDPGHSWTYTYLAWCYEFNGNYTKAVETLKKALELNPRNDAAMGNLGSIYNKTGDCENAIKAWKMAKLYNPTNDWHYVNLGWIYAKNGQCDEAKINFIKAETFSKENDRHYRTLSQCYKEQGNYDEASKYYAKAIRSNSSYYNPATSHNYKILRNMLNRRAIKHIAVQYPMRNVDTLKNMLKPSGSTIFVSN